MANYRFFGLVKIKMRQLILLQHWLIFAKSGTTTTSSITSTITRMELLVLDENQRFLSIQSENLKCNFMHNEWMILLVLLMSDNNDNYY